MKKFFNAVIDGKKLEQDEIVDSVLNHRGITDVASFLRPTEDDLIPFEELIGIDDAAGIVLDTIDKNGTFLIYYDVDTDGSTSGSIMYRYLSNYTDKIRTYIAKGKKHGLSELPLSELDGIDTLIIVDSIDKNPNLYQDIIDLGVEIVVLDHHIVPDSLIESNVYIHLVSSANDYPNPDLTGAGVSLKFAMYLDYLTLNDYAEELYDLCCAGIIADMGNLASPENRYLCHKGLSNLKNPAIKKIIGSYFFDSQSVSFSIAPAINALNRTNNNEIAMRMFMTDDLDEVDDLVDCAKEAKEAQNAVVDALLADLMRQGEAQTDKKCKVFFIPYETTNMSGLLGNKLLSIYQTPVLVVHIDDNSDVIRGSMRAVGVSDFAAMINETGLAMAMGHELAAGFECDENKFNDFLDAIEAKLADVEFSVNLKADVELDPEQINEGLISQFNALNRISGSGFSPVTVMVRSNDYTVSFMSKGKHLKIIDNKTGVIFVKWNDGSYDTLPIDGEFVGVGTISTAYYGRTKYRQVVLNDYMMNTTK